MTLPKLIAFDVDGTLMTHGGRVSDLTRSTLRRLREAGAITVMATGRPVVSVDETLRLTGDFDFAICSNGTTILNLETNEVIRQVVIPGAIASHLISTMRSEVEGIGSAVDLGDTGFGEPGFHTRIPPNIESFGHAPDVLVELGNPPADAHRVTFFHVDHDHDIPSLAALVEPHLDESCTIFFGSQLPLVEVLPAGQNKGAAIEDLARHLGIEAGDVMAFGDGSNDVEMLDWAGRGIAMGPQCSDALLAVAHAVTDTVENDGVANFLEPLLG